VRGALQPIPGVAAIDVVPGRKTVWVAYDPAKVSPEQLLAAVEKAGEPAELKNL
jgi:copper chaperone CopZ